MTPLLGSSSPVLSQELAQDSPTSYRRWYQLMPDSSGLIALHFTSYFNCRLIPRSGSWTNILTSCDTGNDVPKTTCFPGTFHPPPSHTEAWIPIDLTEKWPKKNISNPAYSLETWLLASFSGNTFLGTSVCNSGSKIVRWHLNLNLHYSQKSDVSYN